METIFRKIKRGQITFADFRSFMAAEGFGSEQLSGSLWLFRPRKGKTLPSIQFHRNDGSNDKKLDRVKLIRMAGAICGSGMDGGWRVSCWGERDERCLGLTRGMGRNDVSASTNVHWKPFA